MSRQASEGRGPHAKGAPVGAPSRYCLAGWGLLRGLLLRLLHLGSLLGLVDADALGQERLLGARGVLRGDVLAVRELAAGDLGVLVPGEVLGAVLGGDGEGLVGLLDVAGLTRGGH